MEANIQSPEARTIRNRYLQKRKEQDDLFNLETIRGHLVDQHLQTGMPSGGIRCSWDLIGSVPALRVYPRKDCGLFNTVMIHGGAFCLSSAWAYHRVAAYIAHATCSQVIIPDYCLAPERPYPNALDECLSVVLSTQHEQASGTTMLVGDSAGGNLALAVLLRMRDAGYRMPAGAALLVPWLDLTMSSPDIDNASQLDLVLNVPHMHRFAELYAGNTSPRAPLLSPLFGDLQGLPPICIQAAEHDILRDDSIRLHREILHLDQTCEFTLFPSMLHSFHFHVGNMPEADQAINDLAAFIRKTAQTANP